MFDRSHDNPLKMMVQTAKIINEITINYCSPVFIKHKPLISHKTLQSQVINFNKFGINSVQSLSKMYTIINCMQSCFFVLQQVEMYTVF